MTIGQRIAQKRKEQALSQESLGEALGISRQAIYKWESDSALPEIDKLIALSRLFGVPVGWLLGVEQDAAPEETVSENSGELTETQVQMVEEIVNRYIAAQPAPRKRRKWPFVLTAAALLLALLSLFNRLDRVDEQYTYLQNSINSVQANVAGQIGSISDRVEEVLKAQNDLTADYGVELIARSLMQNTVTFSLRAVPKTYVDGMTAAFLADCGNGPIEFPTDAAQMQAFTREVTLELTDSISLSVVFTYPDGTRQTQLLDNFSGLYAESMPEVNLSSNLMWMDLEAPGTLVLTESTHERYIWIHPSVFAEAAAGPDASLKGPAEIRRIRVGLFKNKQLTAWAEPCAQPDSFHGFEDCSFYRLPALELPLAAADTVQIAAVVEDVYGRTIVQPDMAYCLDTEDLELTPADGVSWDTDPANWEFS